MSNDAAITYRGTLWEKEGGTGREKGEGKIERKETKRGARVPRQSRIIKKAMEGWVACRLCRGIFTALFLYLNIRVKSSEKLPIPCLFALPARRFFCTKCGNFPYFSDILYFCTRDIIRWTSWSSLTENYKPGEFSYEFCCCCCCSFSRL